MEKKVINKQKQNKKAGCAGYILLYTFSKQCEIKVSLNNSLITNNVKECFISKFHLSKIKKSFS